jgi:hypothetical protein
MRVKWTCSAAKWQANTDRFRLKSIISSIEPRWRLRKLSNQVSVNVENALARATPAALAATITHFNLLKAATLSPFSDFKRSANKGYQSQR